MCCNCLWAWSRHPNYFFEWLGWFAYPAIALDPARPVTWLSLWFRGELVVAQTRRRRSWNFGDRTLSGVTGVTGVAEDVPTAVGRAYEGVRRIHFEGMHYRTDIGRRALEARAT